MKRGPLKVFYSYAHEDEAQRDKLDEHLELLARQNLVVRWHDRHVVPGSQWNETIGENLASADIVLLLVSRAFMASKFINEVEVPEAMRLHESGTARVVPILLEDVESWESAPFAELQIIPGRAKAIERWKDPVDAFRDVARGIRRVARDIIIEGGGPFEFGPHEFTEAELGALRRNDRKRATSRLRQLRKDLILSVPSRRFEANLNVATWSLRRFGSARPSQMLPESLFYMAQVITAFDLVALQEIQRNLERLEQLLEILGPDWKVLLTDVMAGPAGNGERFAILYYLPRVEFRNISGQMILPDEGQLARPPLLAAFRSGGFDFQVCSVHILFGRGKDGHLDEVRRACAFLKERARHDDTELLIMGNFQAQDADSPIIKALVDSGIEVPKETLHPTNLARTRFWDAIGFASPKRDMPLGTSDPCAGAYDLFQHVLRDEDRNVYARTAAYREFVSRSSRPPKTKKERERKYQFWKTMQISDHLPLWAELRVDPSEAPTGAQSIPGLIARRN